MSLWQYVTERWDRLSLQAWLHLSGVVQCTILAAIIGVAVGIAVYRSPAGSAVATALSSTVLTIPSFALLGLLIPIVGLGVTPSVIALTLYGLLPIVRNTIVGLAGVDPAVTDAAKGIGMSRTGVLSRVELRMAWPAILTGMRVSAQMLMGIAVIAAYAKGFGLGSEVFSGLTRAGSANSLNQALAGTLGVVILALLLDGVFVLISRLTIPKGVRD
ncbi:ABC transporter permease [Pseudonocardia halophobica]|uniref:ABC transporter permease n=1 Tax=Pseudonocardia halophobica TaxID=29401 RepID=A0A9W6L3R9_9PSEU|nr:ABC transporter permease [Pseudonocardia halophobica]GLL12683.1 ABC transporter permease [Pseudonocardia halophobica]